MLTGNISCRVDVVETKRCMGAPEDDRIRMLPLYARLAAAL